MDLEKYTEVVPKGSLEGELVLIQVPLAQDLASLKGLKLSEDNFRGMSVERDDRVANKVWIAVPSFGGF